MKTRLIIETTEVTKKALDKVLDEQGKTLTDWFNDKVEEAAPFQENIYITNQELSNLKDLENSVNILDKIKNFDWSFKEDDTAYLSHNIHPYPAKYIPQIPNKLIQLLSLRGEKVWDPFGGSGTTALEALLLGRQAISSDINPIAEYIGKAKTKSLTESQDNELRRFVADFKVLVADLDNLGKALVKYEFKITDYTPAITNLDKWFHQFVVNELAFIKFKITETLSVDSQVVAFAVFSKIIIKSSYQDGETRYVSKPRDVAFGSTIKLYLSELTSTLTKIKKLPSLLQFREAQFITANLTTDTVVEPDSIDLIVSSPPYPNATDYHLYHRFRIFWLGFDPRDMAKKEIGSHLRHQKEANEIENYLLEMQQCLQKMYLAIRSGRYVVLVLGDAVFNAASFNTAELLQEPARAVGFEIVGITRRALHETKRSFISAARRLREEKFLILRKPVTNIDFKLIPPPYKLWDYEDILRKQEIKTLFKDKIIRNDQNFRTITINPLDADRFKRLTFTRGFTANNYSAELTWQAILENGHAFEIKSNRKDPKYLTHGIHAYKGKFYPQLAKSLFNLANLKSGDKILDPFSGSGTVLLEGYLNGLQCTGFDLNPLAIKIAKAKTEFIKLDPQVVDRILTQFCEDIKGINDHHENRQIFDESVLEELESWFPSPVLNKLGWLLKLINEIPEPHICDFLEVCLSSVVRDISQQEPKDLRIRRRKEPITDAPVKELFIKKVDEQRKKLISFQEKTKHSPFNFLPVQVVHGDCRSMSPFQQARIGTETIDAIVTSPPYASALPYIDTDRLSILLLFSVKSKQRAEIEKSLIGAREITKRERDATDELITNKEFDLIRSQTATHIIQAVHAQNLTNDAGFRKKNTASLLYRYYNDMAMVLNNIDKVVKKEGSIFFVIGDNRTETNGSKILIKSGKVLQEMGLILGWKLEQVIPITVTQENRLHNKNGIVENEIIWFKK
jgi:DNA modification methylase